MKIPTAEEVRTLLARYNGKNMLPDDLQAKVDGLKQRDREYYRKRAKILVAQGKTVNGTPRKQDYRFHPQLKGLVGRAYHAAYMRIWRGKAA